METNENAGESLVPVAADRAPFWVVLGLIVCGSIVFAAAGDSLTGGRAWQYAAFAAWCLASVLVARRIWQTDPAGGLGRCSLVSGATLLALCSFLVLSFGWPQFSRDSWVHGIRSAADGPAEMAKPRYSVNDLVAVDDSATESNRSRVLVVLALGPAGLMLIRLSLLRGKTLDPGGLRRDVLPTFVLIIPVGAGGIVVMFAAALVPSG